MISYDQIERIFGHPVQHPSPTWRWATVTELSPLRIRMDGDEDDVDATPDDLVGSVNVGQRVLTLRDGRALRLMCTPGGVSDTGVMTGASHYTLEENWSVSSFALQRAGRSVQMAVSATYSGTAITVPADGNITDTPILTLNDSAIRPLMYVPIPGTHTGQMATFAMSSAGIVSLNAVAPGSTIPNGWATSFGGMWIAAG